MRCLPLGMGTLLSRGLIVSRASLTGASPLAAQAPTATSPPNGAVVLSASLRMRGERWDWFGSEPAGSLDPRRVVSRLGEDDPTDARNGTFFQVLPTPRIYARMPFYNLMNLEDVFGSLSLRAARVMLRAEIHGLRLAESADLWYQGGGAFERQTLAR